MGGRADIPIIELHIQFLNGFDIEWDGFQKNKLRPFHYNISYFPFVNNIAKFKGGKHYKTFDIFFKLEFLEGLALSSRALEEFIEKIYKGEPANISPLDRYLTPPMATNITQILKCDFNDRLNKFFIECKVKELLVMMLSQIEQTFSIAPIKLSPYDIECLEAAKNLVVSDFEHQFSLKKISRKCGINEFKLKKGFKHLYGDTVFGHRNGVRMERSRLIILETKLPIHDIAFMVGFEHPENFQKAFKKYWGYTPAELRKGK